jgi:phenylacetate-CoA ligase
VIAVEWPDRTLRVREDHVLIETMSREDGRFDILATVLNNPSFPLIRYAIGDVTEAPIEHPERGFAILKNIVGRDNDFLVSRSDQPLHGTLFEQILEDYAAVRRYRLHQQADGQLDVTVELTHPRAELDLHHVERSLFEHLEFPVRARIVDAIAPSPAGKHRWITSDYALPVHPRCPKPSPNASALA